MPPISIMIAICAVFVGLAAITWVAWYAPAGLARRLALPEPGSDFLRVLRGLSVALWLGAAVLMVMATLRLMAMI